jgi:hypothetical protein
MIRRIGIVATASWFVGGALLGLIELVSLPADPAYSTALQLLPLVFLLGGIWFIVSQFHELTRSSRGIHDRLRKAMILGWFALFGVDAGVASVNNMSTQIFRTPLPYYFQGVSLAQKLIALSGIFVLGSSAILVSHRSLTSREQRSPEHLTSFWDKPVTDVGFLAILLGVVFGLAQYWAPLVFAGFILLLAGAFLYPIGILTEKDDPVSA